MENIKKFYEKLGTNDELKEKAKEIFERHKDSVNGSNISEDFAKDFSEFAKSQGFDFTAQDLMDFTKQPRELSADELEKISGGDRWDDGYISLCTIAFCWLCDDWGRRCADPFYRHP